MERPEIEQIIEIAETVGALGTLWCKYFPSLRLGQLIVCLQTYSHNDLFYMTNEQLIELLEKYGKEREDNR